MPQGPVYQPVSQPLIQGALPPHRTVREATYLEHMNLRAMTRSAYYRLASLRQSTLQSSITRLCRLGFPLNALLSGYCQLPCQSESGRDRSSRFTYKPEEKVEPTSGLQPLTCSLRVIAQALQGVAQACTSC